MVHYSYVLKLRYNKAPVIIKLFQVYIYNVLLYKLSYSLITERFLIMLKM